MGVTIMAKKRIVYTPIEMLKKVEAHLTFHLIDEGQAVDPGEIVNLLVDVRACLDAPKVSSAGWPQPKPPLRRLP